MTKLPAKRRSRGLIRQHERQLPTGRRITVNPGVKKTPRKPPKPTKRTARGTPAARPERSPLRPKLRFTSVLRVDKGDTPLERARKAEKQRDRDGVKLEPGEIVASKFRLYQQHPFSTLGYLRGIDDTGQPINAMMEMRMSNASLIEALQELAERGEKVIIHTDEMGVVDYARPYEKPSIDQETPNTLDMYAIRPALDGSDKIIVEGVMNDGRQVKLRFKDQQTFFKRKEELARQGKNILGEPLYTQRGIDDFTS